MVPWIARQDHEFAWMPGFKPKRSVGDNVPHLSPGLAEHLDSMPGYGPSDAVSQQVEEIARWPFQLHRQGASVEGLHPDPVWIRYLAMMERFGPLDVVQQVGNQRPGGRLQGAFPSVLEVVRGHRGAIAPTHVVSEVEEVPAPAVLDLPGSGDVGHHVHLRRQVHQPAEELSDQVN